MSFSKPCVINKKNNGKIQEKEKEKEKESNIMLKGRGMPCTESHSWAKWLRKALIVQYNSVSVSTLLLVVYSVHNVKKCLLKTYLNYILLWSTTNFNIIICLRMK